MRKFWRLTQDIAISWLPFAFALYLAHSTLSRIARTDLKVWEPTFYAFLPMCFFFVGIGLFAGRHETRQLREAIAKLRASAG